MSDDDQPPVKRQKNMYGLPSPATPGLLCTQMPSPANSTFPPSTAMVKRPESTVDVCDDGDVILMADGVGGSATPIGIRVSGQVLSITSPVFKQMLHDHLEANADGALTADHNNPKTLDLTASDDGDTLFLLMNVLHLRNDSLPMRIEPDALSLFAAMATKYDCVNAAGRTASTWFDHIYAKYDTPPIFQMIEAAFLLNDAVWFARFTTRFVLRERTGQEASSLSNNPDRFELAQAVLARQRQVIDHLKSDLELLIEPCAEALASEHQHLMGCSPDEGENEHLTGEPTDACYVDKEGGTEFLVALRDDDIWPSSRWPNILDKTVRAIANHTPPDLNTIDSCYFCIDVHEKYAEALSLVQAMHKERLWGICLDCVKNNGLFIGECRYEHFKLSTVSAQTFMGNTGN